MQPELAPMEVPSTSWVYTSFANTTARKEPALPKTPQQDFRLRTDVCRNNIDKDFWVKKIQKRVETNIKNNIITIIPDVRYKNEIQWIKNLGGYVIHVSRCGIEPANLEEKANDPIVEKLSDYKLKWKNFSDEKKTCTRHVAELFRENGWSLYGKFK